MLIASDVAAGQSFTAGKVHSWPSNRPSLKPGTLVLSQAAHTDPSGRVAKPSTQPRSTPSARSGWWVHAPSVNDDRPLSRSRAQTVPSAATPSWEQQGNVG